MRLAASAVTVVTFLFGLAPASFGADVRVTKDNGGGYVSVYTMATGVAYTDAVLDECSIARGRQNEPAIAVNPRDTRVLIGSANDYCGVYAGSPPGNFVPAGPIWVGYYRSEDSGANFQNSLVPGYAADTSPYGALASIRTASSGDPVIAWDGHGRVFIGAEASEDPAGSKKSFGDVWVARFDNPGGALGNTLDDGKRFVGSAIVARGVAAPDLLGKSNDKTAIQADRTGGACDGNVYFAWSRFAGAAGDSSIYFARSTDHGATWSTPRNLTPNNHNVQFPDISVTGNGHVYMTFRQKQSVGRQPDAIMYVKSGDCGRSFGPPRLVTTFVRNDAQDIRDPQPLPLSSIDDPLLEAEETAPGSPARDCGDFANRCQSGYTFFRRDTQVRSIADQYDPVHEYVYMVYDATKPGTEVDTGTTYGTVNPGRGSQAAIYFVRLNGATGTSTTPALIDDQVSGHQIFPHLGTDGGVLNVMWWDSRDDLAPYSAQRPIGNDAAGKSYPALDVRAATSTNGGASWSPRKTPLNAVRSNPNYEQFDNRTVPFAGDYLWVTSIGDFAYGVWTDWRDTIAGSDPREALPDDKAVDVLQCRTFDATWSGDQCPHDGGLDQNIYGARLH